MKKLVPCLCFLIFLVNNPVSAQIQINSTDMPIVDTIYHFHNASTTDVGFDFTGADVVWDYTFLEETGFSETSFSNPGTTPLVYQLVFNNFLYPTYDCTHAKPGNDITFPSQIPLEITEVFNFYKNTSTSFSIMGFGATINSIPTPIQYTGKDRLYKFPMTYGNMDTSSYFFEVNIPSFGYWNQSGTRENHVDGFGTLMLPNNYSYEVIRLKSVLHIIDTLYLDLLGFAIPLPRTQTEYKFMAIGEGEPVLQITTQPLLLIGGPETVTSVIFKNEMNLDGIETNENYDLAVYPNPATEQITISNPQGLFFDYFCLMDRSGRVISSSLKGSESSLIMDISALSSGNYQLIAITSDQKIFRRSIVVQ